MGMQPAIAFDAVMSVRAALERLALHGFWSDAANDVVRRRVQDVAQRLKLTPQQAASRLKRDDRDHAAAVRRQRGTRIFWYAYSVPMLLDRITRQRPDATLEEALNLHESDPVPAVAPSASPMDLPSLCVVVEDGAPLGVYVEAQAAAAFAAPAPRAPAYRSRGQRARPPAAGAEPPAVTPVWPRVEAPSEVVAAQVFEVEVGFAATKQAGVAGEAFRLPFTDTQDAIDVNVELIAAGISAPEGWSRRMRVQRNDVTPSVRFRLVADAPDAAKGATLTMLEVRYVVAGVVCGTAARPLVVRGVGVAAGEGGPPGGTEWRDMPATASAVSLVPDPHAPDLTIEIGKPDRNAADGRYVCTLRSPHALDIDPGPFDLDLGHDARTFAKSMVDEIRLFADNELLEQVLCAQGELVASRLPRKVFDALARVQAVLAGQVPSVLIVSAEPYVPWELAWMEKPLDKSRPSFLGAQALVGRWLREDPGEDDATGRPAPHPLSAMQVGHLAVMAAQYKEESRLDRLWSAEEEARTLAKTFPSLPLPGTAAGLKQLLNGEVAKDFDTIPVDAVHFAGHGDFDPTQPDGSSLFLEDGTPLRSMLFRAAKYGGEHQPLMFLNACMLGIGGELLGDMGGFPGNSLRGGFGGVLGALWEVDDQLAHDIALEFWKRALPAAPGAGEPVGAILRDLRAKYAVSAGQPPLATYLAYVYYGHPRLTLQRPA